MRLTEQVDRTGDRLTYSWLLDAPYRHRKHFPLWKWVSGRGCKGCFVTNDAAAARYVADGFDLNVESNGSHQALNAPMLFDAEPARGATP